MSNFLVLLFLFFGLTTSLQSQTKSPLDAWSSSLFIGYQGHHQSGAFVHLNTVYDNKYGLEIGYGSDFLNSYSITGKYFINDGLNQFYTGTGYTSFSLKQKLQYSFQINTVHVLLGYQSVVFDNWIIGEELDFVKYIDQNFKLPGITYKERFDLYERWYFQIGIFVGYRLDWDRWM